jgi:hypothetical protein
MRRSFGALLLGSSLLLGGSSIAAAATPEHVLDGEYRRDVALALDAAGHRHLVATSAEGDLWYATDRTGSWEAQRILGVGVPGSFVWSHPTIATDGKGRVHVAAVRDYVFDAPGSTGGIFYKTDKGRPRGDFGPRTRIAGPMMTSPSLKVVGGVRYLAYAKCACLPEQKSWPVFFKTDRSGSWQVERIRDRGADPALRVDGKGRARIAFSDRKGLRYTRARTNLGDLTMPVRIPGTEGRQGVPSLALDEAGRPHVAWASWSPTGPRVRYLKRTAAGWIAPRRLGAGVTTEISLDASGRPHVVFAWKKVIHRWLAAGAWKRTELTGSVDPLGVDIRAFGKRATVAWTQDDTPRGAWVVLD